MKKSQCKTFLCLKKGARGQIFVPICIHRSLMITTKDNFIFFFSPKLSDLFLCKFVHLPIYLRTGNFLRQIRLVFKVELDSDSLIILKKKEF